MNPFPLLPISLPAIAVAIGLIAALPTAAQADRVRTKTGSVSGEVTETTRMAVTIETSGEEKELPVNQVVGVLYEDEPSALSQARINAENGGYATALEKLDGVTPREIDNPLVRQDLAFYLAYCEARLAMVGERDAAAATKRLTDFLRKNGDSFHYFRTLETLGELFVSAGDFEKAGKAFGMLAKAPVKAYQLRAGVLAGRAEQSRGDHAAAIERFDGVLAAGGAGGSSEELEATLGKAASLAELGRLDEGLELTRRVLSEADPEDTALQAAGYNTLGRCHEAAGESLDALFAFLHTDLLFSGQAESHAEALARLGPLWDAAGKPDEARDARRRLQRRYAQTRWARETR